MIAPSMSLERMVERGKALHALEEAGVDVTLLIDLDRAVRRGLVTDDHGAGEERSVSEYRAAEEEERVVLDTIDDMGRFVGRWLVARGQEGLWRELFHELAREDAFALGPDAVEDGPLPPGAALRWLEGDAGAP